MYSKKPKRSYTFGLHDPDFFFISGLPQLLPDGYARLSPHIRGSSLCHPTKGGNSLLLCSMGIFLVRLSSCSPLSFDMHWKQLHVFSDNLDEFYNNMIFVNSTIQ